MGSRKTITLLCLVANVTAALSQDTWYGSVTGMEMMYNPAYTGSSGDGRMRISCYSFLPGAGFGLQSVYASYDDYSQTLHGGAGIWVADDMMGEVLNDLRAGMSYAYHLKAGSNLFFNAGLTASVVHRGINRGAVTFPGDFDPFGGLVSPPGETVSDAGSTLFDLGSGVTFSSGPWYGGFAVMHLAQPYLDDNHQDYNRLERLYTFNAGRVIFSKSTGTGTPAIGFNNATGRKYYHIFRNFSLFQGTCPRIGRMVCQGWLFRSGTLGRMEFRFLKNHIVI